MTIHIAAWVTVALLLSLCFWAGYGARGLRERRRLKRRFGGFIRHSLPASGSANRTTGKTRTPPATSTASSGLRATAAVRIPGRATSPAPNRISLPTDSGSGSESPHGGRMTGADVFYAPERMREAWKHGAGGGADAA